MAQQVPDPLAGALHRFFHVNTMRANWADLISGFVDSGLNPEWPALFRRQLAGAILDATVTPAQYEALTGEDLTTQEDVRAELLEIWTALYGDEPVSADPA